VCDTPKPALDRPNRAKDGPGACGCGGRVGSGVRSLAQGSTRGGVLFSRRPIGPGAHRINVTRRSSGRDPEKKGVSPLADPVGGFEFGWVTRDQTERRAQHSCAFSGLGPCPAGTIEREKVEMEELRPWVDGGQGRGTAASRGRAWVEPKKPDEAGAGTPRSTSG